MEDAKIAQMLALRLRYPVPLIDDLLGRSVFYEERRGDFARARKAADTASAEARLHNDTISLVSTLIARGVVHQLQGNISVSDGLLEEAIDLSGGTAELQYRALVYSSQISSLKYDYFADGGAAVAKDIQPNFDSEASLRAWTDRINKARSFVNNKALLLEGRMLQRRRTVMRPPRIGADRYDATTSAQLRIWASAFQADRDWFESDKADARNLAALDLLLGDVLFKAGDLPKALEKVEKATETYRVLEDTIGKANCASKLGDFLVSPVSTPDVWNCFLTEGSSDNSLHWRIEASEADTTSLNVSSARVHYKNAATFYKTGNSLRGLARIETRLGYLDVLEASSALDSESCYRHAEKHIRDASNLFEEGEDWYGYHLSQAQLALCRIGAGELPEDQDLAIKIGEWGQSSGSFSYSLSLGLFISRVGRRWLVQSGDYERALACFRLAASCCSALGALLAYVQSIKDQMNVYEMIGDSSGFIRMAERGLDECQALAHRAPARKSQASTEAKWIIVQSLGFANNKVLPDLIAQIRDRVNAQHSDGTGLFADLTESDHKSQDLKSLMDKMMEELDRNTQDVSNLMNALHVATSAKSSNITGAPVVQPSDTFGDIAVTGFAKLMVRQSFFYEQLYRGKQARRFNRPHQAEKSFGKAKHIAQTDNVFRSSFMIAMVSAYQDQIQNAVESFNRYLEEEDRSSRIFAPTPVLQEDKVRNMAQQALSFFCEMEAFSDAQRYIDILLQDSGQDWWQQEERPWEYLRLIAIVEEGTGKLVQALRTYKHAMDLFEQRRRRLSVDQLKLAFAGNSTTQSIYFKATRVALKLREHASDEEKGRAFEAEAFEALERGKARSLLDLMASGAMSRGEEPMADAAVRRWRRLGAFLASRGGLLQLALSDKNPNAENIVKLKKEILDTEEELRVAETEMSTGRSTTISLIPDVIKLDHLVAKLNDTTALLQYVFSPYELITWAITSQGMVQLHRVSTEYYHLEQQIRVFHDKCRLGERLSVESERLSKLLLEPFEDTILSCSKLLIVPYGSLHILPFQALPWQDQPLGITHAISYLPSASAMAYMESRETLNSVKGVLAIGNPSNMGDRPLPGSEMEAKTIAEYMPDSKALTGPDATFENLLGEIHKYSILHFATHCNLRADVPLLSSVQLAGGKALTVYELMDLHLDVDLIVLSACQTGRGETTAGDDVVGLSRALLAAGARAVLVTLWPVDDLATCLLLINFYQRLQNSEPTAQALQGAQNYLRQSSKAASDSSSPSILLRGLHDELASLHASEKTINKALARVQELVQDQDSEVPESSMVVRDLKPPSATSPAVRDYSRPNYWAPFILIGV